MTHGQFSGLHCRQSLTTTLDSNTANASTGNTLGCILLNVRSVHKHAIEIWNLLDSLSPDIAFFMETWTNSSSAPDINTAIPDGYKIQRKDCHNHPGGGLAITHKSTLHLTTSS